MQSSPKLTLPSSTIVPTAPDLGLPFVSTEPKEVLTAGSTTKSLGTLTVKAGEQVLQQIPLVAEISVPKLRFPQLYVRVFKQLCMAK